MNKILLFAAAISFNLFASEPGAVQFGRIVELKGSGFISYKGKTREIKKGDVIDAGSEIVIEHHGQVTFTDNADHRFHLGNSSSARVSSNIVELRSGDLWFQSLNKNDEYKIQTANAIVNYQGGEAIVSYDSVKGKTQLMVINSMMKLGNLHSPELNLSIAEGHFSFIDNAYDEGAPRDPTPVGEKTYGALVALFNGIAPMDKNSAAIFKDHEKKEEHAKVEPVRAIASVPEHADKNAKMLEEYKNSVLNKTHAKKPVTKKVSKTKIPSGSLVHVYGKTSTPTVALTLEAPRETKSRAPASVLDQDVPSEAASPAANNPYSKEYKNQHESDKLIDDLKKL
ncbi:MAG: hypothetical protein WC635_09955 [Bacteriovorax sp.]|jgi:hypothetical protein